MIKRHGYLLDVFILLGALLLQQTLVSWLAIGAVRPDLVLIALTAVALRHGPVAGLYAGLLIGLVQDVYAVETLGANVLAKGLVGYALGFFEEKVMKVMAATRVVLLAVALFVHDVLFLIAAGHRGGFFWDALLWRSLPSAVYTLVLGALVFYFATGFKPREN
jgi:rod shape-determining protein MreD